MLESYDSSANALTDGWFDKCLTRMATSEDTGSFIEIYDYYAGRIKGFLLSREMSPTEAETYMQEIMLRVWHSAKDYDSSVATSSTWIFQLTRDYLLENVRGVPRVESDSADGAKESGSVSLT